MRILMLLSMLVVFNSCTSTIHVAPHNIQSFEQYEQSESTRFTHSDVDGTFWSTDDVFMFGVVIMIISATSGFYIGHRRN